MTEYLANVKRGDPQADMPLEKLVPDEKICYSHNANEKGD
jgi:hypothetical protein